MFENVWVKGSLRPAYFKSGFEKEYRLLDEKEKEEKKKEENENTRNRSVPDNNKRQKTP